MGEPHAYVRLIADYFDGYGTRKNTLHAQSMTVVR